MLTTSVLTAAASLTLLLLKVLTRASPNVYLPILRRGSATSSSATIHPARNPMLYMKPSNPEKAISPAMPRKLAALR